MPQLIRFKEVGAEAPHGIYVYDRSSDFWVLTSVGGDAFRPLIDGYYVIYFDNAKCHACRAYDTHWFPYLRRVARELPDHYFIIVLCEWFAQKCNSEAASKTFKEFDVHASPTTYLLHVRGGNVIYKEKYEGSLNYAELEEVIKGFRTRAERAERGEEVKLPKKEVDINEIIKKLLEILSKAEKPDKQST